MWIHLLAALLQVVTSIALPLVMHKDPGPAEGALLATGLAHLGGVGHAHRKARRANPPAK